MKKRKSVEMIIYIYIYRERERERERERAILDVKTSAWDKAMG